MANLSLRLLFYLAIFLSDAFSAAAGGKLPYRPPLRPFKGAGSNTLSSESNRDLIEDCKEDYRDVHLDHFSWVRIFIPCLGKCKNSADLNGFWRWELHTKHDLSIIPCRLIPLREERSSSRGILSVASIGSPTRWPGKTGQYFSMLEMRQMLSCKHHPCFHHWFAKCSQQLWKRLCGSAPGACIFYSLAPCLSNPSYFDYPHHTSQFFEIFAKVYMCCFLATTKLNYAVSARDNKTASLFDTLPADTSTTQASCGSQHLISELCWSLLSTGEGFLGIQPRYDLTLTPLKAKLPCFIWTWLC